MLVVVAEVVILALAAREVLAVAVLAGVIW
jgi:hypothetical protein